MASAKWTLIGMYQYDNTIFNDMVLPTGIDADLFKQSLLMEKGEFEVLYPNPDFMKHSIQLWSAKWFRTFSEWLKGTQAQWNPIYNYDRYEEGWDDHNRKYASVNNADYSDKRTTDMEELNVLNLHDKREADLKDKRTADLSENRILNTKDSNEKNLKDESTFNNQDTTSQTKESTTEHQVAGYDSATYQPSSKDIIDNGDSKVKHTGTVTNETTGTDTTAHSGTDETTTRGTDTTAHTGSETNSHTGSDRNTTSGTDEMVHKGKLSDLSGTEKNTNQHTAHLYGNIGVITSSAMLAEFYNIAKWNLYEHMADVFGSELLIQVY